MIRRLLARLLPEPRDYMEERREALLRPEAKPQPYCLMCKGTGRKIEHDPIYRGWRVCPCVGDWP